MNPTDLIDTSGDFCIQAFPPAARWYLDARRPQTHCVITHGHTDHIGRHGRVLCTAPTAEMLKMRLYSSKTVPEKLPKFTVLPFQEPWSDGPLTFELFPAGHVLGSAMVRVTTPRGRFLYTGDFRLRPDSLTVTPAQIPEADVVLMECTYGKPHYRFPPRSEVSAQLCELAHNALKAGQQPICLCYPLGKAQEVTAILTRGGLPVSLPGPTHKITEMYGRYGVALDNFRVYDPETVEGTVLVAPPGFKLQRGKTPHRPPYIIAITGWALDSSCIYRYGANAAVALSDHADFDELTEFARLSGAKHILLTHGFEKEFASHLRGLGLPAGPARPPAQGALFEV